MTRSLFIPVWEGVHVKDLTKKLTSVSIRKPFSGNYSSHFFNLSVLVEMFPDVCFLVVFLFSAKVQKSNGKNVTYFVIFLFDST